MHACDCAWCEIKLRYCYLPLYCLLDEESFTKYASKQAKNLFLQSACSQDFPDAGDFSTALTHQP